MPTGMPYFAWIDPGETVFGPGHMRWDESVFSFTLKQDEGDPASLTVVVRRPRNEAGDAIGLLGPGRKIWAWFALDCGPALIKFRGRLVGIPTSIFEELVTLEFVAKPIDLVAQKAALADTLRVLPYYDEVVIDPTRRTDPDVVLEGYTSIWHYDCVTHIITISDEITGEDGIVEFDGASEDGKVLYDGLGLTLTTGPLTRVDVSAEYTWNQQASGNVDLTGYLNSHWNDYIYLNASDWPKSGGGLGEGWTVAESSAQELFDYTLTSTTSGSTSIVKWGDGDTSNTTFRETKSSFSVRAGPIIQLGYAGAPKDEIKVTYSKDGDDRIYASAYSRNYSSEGSVIGLQAIRASLIAAYAANRPCTEVVTFTLFADVQPILTDPDDGEALSISDVKSVNLSEPIGEGTAAYVPMGDVRRRSYISTARGNQSLEHLIALARANLMKRARAVEITFAPKLSRMPEITLRKSAFLAEPRVGEALGKIIGYSIALDGTNGTIKCEVKIGCAIGYGGLVTAIDGMPTYCSTDYVGSDYQQFFERTVLVDGFTDSSVGYQPPSAAPNDDGINFLSGVSVGAAIDTDLSVVMGPQEGDDSLTAQFHVRATFKLKSMTRSFSTPYEIQVTDLKIPTGYDLEAV
jgi:hypothetical protein